MSEPYQYRFAPRAPSDVADLIDAHPLAWVVSRSGERMKATTLPLLVRRDDHGAPAAFEGHFARSNPQLAELQRDPRALILFLGPHNYISPTWVSDPAWGPTWNYAHAQFETAIEFFDQPKMIEAHLRALVAHMERDRPGAWSPDDMGPRFATLARGVIGFNASIVRADARFKLGQDERRETFADICTALEGTELGALMERQASP